MLAYAANRPDPAGRRSSPNVMLFIVAVHIAAIAALMSAKIDLARHLPDPPLTIDFLRPPPPPPPPPPTGHTKTAPQPRNPEWVSHPNPQTPTPPVPQPPVDTGGSTSSDPGPTGPVPIPQPPQPQPHPTVQSGPTLLTPASQLRPPYPEMKLLNEEEADLRLRLMIGADGRVTAVDAVGRADPVFLDAARRYITDHWRYRPATVDGRAIATSLVISLSFRLDG